MIHITRELVQGIDSLIRGNYIFFRGVVGFMIQSTWIMLLLGFVILVTVKICHRRGLENAPDELITAANDANRKNKLLIGECKKKDKVIEELRAEKNAHDQISHMHDE